MVVPDPNGAPFNKDKVMLRPNDGNINTDISTYRPEEIIKL